MTTTTETGHQGSRQGPPRAEPQDGRAAAGPVRHLHSVRTAESARVAPQGEHVQEQTSARPRPRLHGSKVVKRKGKTPSRPDHAPRTKGSIDASLPPPVTSVIFVCVCVCGKSDLLMRHLSVAIGAYAYSRGSGSGERRGERNVIAFRTHDTLPVAIDYPYSPFVCLGLIGIIHERTPTTCRLWVRLQLS